MHHCQTIYILHKSVLVSIVFIVRLPRNRRWFHLHGNGYRDNRVKGRQSTWANHEARGWVEASSSFPVGSHETVPGRQMQNCKRKNFLSHFEVERQWIVKIRPISQYWKFIEIVFFMIQKTLGIFLKSLPFVASYIYSVTTVYFKYLNAFMPKSKMYVELAQFFRIDDNKIGALSKCVSKSHL